ncbi:hypothetical protein FQN52_002311 [Onygenales sp. PD_12]|nr:hypothetical protein FQN52_002311 [Onygenales sp. PD_12]
MSNDGYPDQLQPAFASDPRHSTSSLNDNQLVQQSLDTTVRREFGDYDHQQVQQAPPPLQAREMDRMVSGKENTPVDLSGEQLLQKKRALALAALSQKRAASKTPDPAKSSMTHGGSGPSSTPSQEAKATFDPPKHPKRRASNGGIANYNQEPPPIARSNTEEKPRSHQMASPEDIDGLLAEGRVSANVNAFNTSTAGQSGVDFDKHQTSDIGPGEHSSPTVKTPVHKRQPTNGSHKKDHDDKNTPSSNPSEVARANSMDGCSASPKGMRRAGTWQDSRSDQKTYPERRIYEPPKRSLTDSSAMRPVNRNDSSHSRSSGTSDKLSPSRMTSNPEVDNEFARLEPSEIEELREWLMHTNYYDESYRRSALIRHKRLAALDREREELMREEMHEREALAKNSDRGPSSFSPKLSFDTSMRDVQASPSQSMPPPPFVPKISTPSGPLKPADSKKGPSSGVSDESPSSHISRESGSSTLKRQHPEVERHTGDDRAEKLARTDTTSKESNRSHDTEAVPDFMNKARREFIQGSGSSSADDFMAEGEQDKHNNGCRVISSNGSIGAGSLKLAAGGVTYFLIKCVAYDMVDAAKTEGIWATQQKNVDKITEAFDNSRHVVLFFSVNNSGAFQGYARLESRPGAHGIPDPSWIGELNWEASAPFKITWLNTEETKFKYVAHIKNPYNEGSVVFFGRDGQELEADCGRDLCEHMDKSIDYAYASEPF